MKYIIITTLSILLLAACDTSSKTTQGKVISKEQKKETSTTEPVMKDDFHGKWTMVSYMAFMPDIPEFSEGDVVWEFDSHKKMVNVTKRDGEKHKVAGPSPGEYSYSVEPKDIIVIKGKKHFYSFKDGKLKLDTNTNPRLSKDLPVMHFVRIK